MVSNKETWTDADILFGGFHVSIGDEDVEFPDYKFEGDAGRAGVLEYLIEHPGLSQRLGEARFLLRGLFGLYAPTLAVEEGRLEVQFHRYRYSFRDLDRRFNYLLDARIPVRNQIWAVLGDDIPVVLVTHQHWWEEEMCPLDV